MNLSLAHMLHRVAPGPARFADDAESLVRRLFKDHPAPEFSVRLWDGRDVSFGRPIRFTVCFQDRETFTSCIRSGDPSEFAEAYVDGRLRVEGDLEKAVTLFSYLATVELSVLEKLAMVSALGVRPTRHTVRADTRDVQTHYDLSDEFFRLFLDGQMIYSCAYFASERDTLEDAQRRKLDLVCRKLRLAPGESLLDIGCGWGALAIWAARRYGVRAHGITLSANQAAEARRRVDAAGLSDRVTIEQRHYAELPPATYDKVASIGMYEHVGIDKLPVYFRTVRQSLRPGGLFLNHGITAPARRPSRNGGMFIGRHVFPGGELDGVPHLQALMEDEGFEIVDVESLRRHYAMTLTEWYRRFKAARSSSAALVPERVIRTWDLYLAGCAHAFAAGMVGIHQVLAARLDEHGQIRAPLTRNDLLV